jgi:hypothetical protein
MLVLKWKSAVGLLSKFALLPYCLAGGIEIADYDVFLYVELIRASTDVRN